MTDILHVSSVHFTGIKGIAMAALALWAKDRGIRVTGSDVREEFPSDPMLREAGIPISPGFDVTHVNSASPPELLVYTGAHGGIDNCEVQEALRLGIPVLPHGMALGVVMKQSKQISVAGSHGKTTTSAMIATVLKHAGLDPSYAIGCGNISGLGKPGHAGKGAFFVAEADEYVTDPHHDQTPRFLWQHPEILVVTNIDFDHPDAYENLNEVKKAFVSFTSNLTGKRLVIVNSEDPESAVLVPKAGEYPCVTYGMNTHADYMVSHIEYGRGKTEFDVRSGTDTVSHLTIHVPGVHNVLNATAAAAASHAAGVAWKVIEEGLAIFGGAKRRFEHLETRRGVRFFDDYAHHPKEITATIDSAKLWFADHRIIAVFQPHTYSRTRSLLHEFATAFNHADIVIISEIYASAREKGNFGIDGSVLVSEIRKHHPNVVFAGNKEDVNHELKRVGRSGDIVLFMGAGDIYQWEKDVIRDF